MVEIFDTVDSWKKKRAELQKEGKILGLVATMGALHEGHLRLIEEAKKSCDYVVLSIFVNPTQFNEQKDLDGYPRTLEKDILLAETRGVDAVFTPTYALMYPDDYNYRVSEEKLSKVLEGEFRPGHFTGMLTIVLKLLLMIQPKKAFFGEKDYQQFLLIKGLAEAFFLDTEVIPVSTVREEDGLAMSSRNTLLTEEERKLAPKIFSEISSKKSLGAMKDALEQEGFSVEYLEENFSRRFVAAKIGKVRLIDNVSV